MRCHQLLQPDLVLGDVIFGLTLDLIRQHQLRGLVLDVDETLVPIRQAEIDPEVVRWAAIMRSYTQLWLVSNNLNAPRIRRIAERLDLPYVAGAGKPSRRKIRQVVRAMDLPVHQVAIVGDRLFTDILAGNRLGLFTILVEPMVPPDQALRTSPMRTVEVWLSTLMGNTLKQ
ncbi:YqeG family HAD IIIA-type phosphatase [filamentous cyanobacterium CCP5]|nr:YqeG family HAD IIIA-type phosphatase [filamentous cyanobacterium CCP5]